MTNEWSVPVWAVCCAVALALVVVGVWLLTVRALRRARLDAVRAVEQARAEAHAEAAGTRERLAEIERQLTAVAPAAAPEYTITSLGQEAPKEPTPSIPAPLFADLVVRESVVKTASLWAGLRHALSPETRNRIRFEMRREVKRSRKQRKADLKQARREYEARQRAAA